LTAGAGRNIRELAKLTQAKGTRPPWVGRTS
jgi:hypothetical protein